jgi:hypothetical protein
MVFSLAFSLGWWVSRVRTPGIRCRDTSIFLWMWWIVEETLVCVGLEKRIAVCAELFTGSIRERFGNPSWRV